MIRPFAVLAFLALGLGAANAQDAAPAAATPGAVVNPTDPLSISPKQANMLTGFYATQAVIELCALSIDPAILAGMDADRQRLELALGMDVATAGKAYAQVKTDVETTTPDCTDGSTDRIGVDAVTAIYSALPTAGTVAAPAAPATETPAQ